MKKIMVLGEEAIILIAKDIIQNIVDGGTEIVDELPEKVNDHKIELLKICISAGLERSEAPKVHGLHALARLICLSEIVNFGEELSNDQQDNGPSVFLTADVLLMFLIGPDAEKRFDGFFSFYKGRVKSIQTRDAELVSALFSVKEGDNLNAKTFAKLVNAVTIQMINVGKENRRNWSISDELIEKIRAKALNH